MRKLILSLVVLLPLASLAADPKPRARGSGPSVRVVEEGMLDDDDFGPEELEPGELGFRLAMNDAPGLGEGPQGGALREEMHQRLERRMRLRRMLELADTLGLSESEALKANETLSRFDQKRAPLRKELEAQVAILRKAADGDASARGQVEGAARKLFELKGALVNVDREMYDALVQGMTPEKRAKAALFFARFQDRMQRLVRTVRHERMEERREPRK